MLISMTHVSRTGKKGARNGIRNNSNSAVRSQSLWKQLLGQSSWSTY